MEAEEGVGVSTGSGDWEVAAGSRSRGCSCWQSKVKEGGGSQEQKGMDVF